MITRSKFDRIFIASWGSIRPSLIKSSSVSVRERPILDKENRVSIDISIRLFHLGEVKAPATAIKLIVCLSAHFGELMNRMKFD